MKNLLLLLLFTASFNLIAQHDPQATAHYNTLRLGWPAYPGLIINPPHSHYNGSNYYSEIQSNITDNYVKSQSNFNAYIDHTPPLRFSFSINDPRALQDDGVGRASSAYFYGIKHVMTLLPKGNVGIGIMEPTQLLHVNGTARVEKSLLVGGSVGSSTNTNNEEDNYLRLEHNGTEAQIEAYNATNGLAFYVNADGGIGAVDHDPVMTLSPQPGGYLGVGLGNTLASAQLHVKSSAVQAIFEGTANVSQISLNLKKTTDNVALLNQSGTFSIYSPKAGAAGTGESSFNVSPNGFVGIGTSTPTSALSVKSTNHFPAIFESDQNHCILRLISSNDHTKGVEFVNRPGGRAAIWVDGAKNLTGSRKTQDGLSILQNGNVGLGVNAPKHNLEVAENIRSEGLMVGTDVLVPGTVLTIDGAVYISSDDDTNPLTADDKEYTIASSYLDEYSLWVDDGIVTDDIAIADPTLWSDYVFEEDYELPTLDSLKAYILEHKHLPNIPSEESIKKEGYTLHTMNTLFLEKIEELTLYTIEQQNEIDNQQLELKRLQNIEERLLMIEQKLLDVDSQSH